jgi:uncharacterized protein YndB with AHSA1/START domain
MVNRQPEEVFSYLADVSRHVEWSPKTFRAEGLAGPLAVGSKWVSYGAIPGDSQRQNDVEVTEYQPPSRLAFVSQDQKEGEFINTFVLAPEGGGTRVERNVDMPKPSGFMGLIFPILMPMYLRPYLKEGLNLFKKRMEEQPA